jgi:hypothetical protein
MARQYDPAALTIKDKSVIMMDCGSSSSVIGSLLNAYDVIEKMTNIETANGVDSMRATHTCLKAYFLRNREKSKQICS